MAQPALTGTGEALPRPEGLQGIVADWSSDQRAFKNVPWGKAMMWIFLLSDTFIFSSFLISYMTVRMSTTVPWPNPSEVFALTIGGKSIPLILIAIMTFILISSRGTSTPPIDNPKTSLGLGQGTVVETRTVMYEIRNELKMNVSLRRKIHIIALPQGTFLNARWSEDQSATMPCKPSGRGRASPVPASAGCAISLDPL